ncbi:MAG: hypothetical protein ABW195_10325 [Ilumatobacteraceae bacterium]
MGWDASRPVPWRRLVKEWLIYAAIMAVVFAVFFRDDNIVAILGGLVVSGPLYLGLGWVLAKFGYTRKTLGDLGTPRAGSSKGSGGTGQAVGTGADDAAARARPAPTRRTSTGRNRPVKGKRR